MDGRAGIGMGRWRWRERESSETNGFPGSKLDDEGGDGVDHGEICSRGKEAEVPIAADIPALALYRID